MTKEEALEILKRIQQENGDKEEAHMAADDVLLRLIDDEEIQQAFNDIDKWYA